MASVKQRGGRLLSVRCLELLLARQPYGNRRSDDTRPSARLEVHTLQLVNCGGMQVMGENHTRDALPAAAAGPVSAGGITGFS